VFAALRACPDPAAVKVIILGQDPYPTAGNAHGLSFSVRPEVKPPASLQNIYKELNTDVGVKRTSGCLSDWAEQGVLLLNDVLTVTVGAPQSHSGAGWEGLTARILSAVLDNAPHVVIIAWGRFAQKKLEERTIASLIAARGHTVIRAPHPSPLSAHTGFFGSRPFSKTNAALVAHGIAPIVWG
jgi:uracil-DNA glycosylase